MSRRTIQRRAAKGLFPPVRRDGGHGSLRPAPALPCPADRHCCRDRRRRLTAHIRKHGRNLSAEGPIVEIARAHGRVFASAMRIAGRQPHRDVRNIARYMFAPSSQMFCCWPGSFSGLPVQGAACPHRLRRERSADLNPEQARRNIIDLGEIEELARTAVLRFEKLAKIVTDHRITERARCCDSRRWPLVHSRPTRPDRRLRRPVARYSTRPNPVCAKDRAVQHYRCRNCRRIVRRDRAENCRPRPAPCRCRGCVAHEY